jgi:hypothetical protein
MYHWHMVNERAAEQMMHPMLDRYHGQVEEVIRTQGEPLKSAVNVVAQRAHSEDPSMPVQLLEVGLLYHYMRDQMAEINELGRDLLDGFEAYKKDQGASAARAQREVGEMLGLTREGARFLFQRPRTKG